MVNASFMDGDLTGRHSGTTDVVWEGKSPNQTVDFEILGVGYDLIDMLGINILEGRQFSREFGSEGSKLIFNQAAIKAMGITDPVGKTVNLWGEDKQIIGVVDNFHFESLYEDVKPFFFRFSEGRVHEILVKLASGRERETLANLTSFYRKYGDLFLIINFWMKIFRQCILLKFGFLPCRGTLQDWQF
ncbi:MAG: hypothetical protein IPF54_23360 [Draconibacterium sp.]|nr:hypothetical protein [Draconibacterium sp.]